MYFLKKLFIRYINKIKITIYKTDNNKQKYCMIFVEHYTQTLCGSYNVT